MAKVAFYAGATKLGEDTTAPYAFTWSSAPAGTQVLTAVATDDDGATTTSAAVSIVVGGTTTFSLDVAFRPRGTATPTGYVADHGLTFAAREGHSYGWSADLSATARLRQSPVSSDTRYDGLVLLQKPGFPAGVWEVAVPNGEYAVRLIAGDALYLDSVHAFLVEGQPTAAFTPTTQQRWSEITVNRTVGDGRLTVAPRPGR